MEKMCDCPMREGLHEHWCSIWEEAESAPPPVKHTLSAIKTAAKMVPMAEGVEGHASIEQCIDYLLDQEAFIDVELYGEECDAETKAELELVRSCISYLYLLKFFADRLPARANREEVK